MKVKNWIKSFGVTSDKWYGKISLTKLDGLCKVDVQESNTGVLGDTNFPDSEDLTGSRSLASSGQMFFLRSNPKKPTRIQHHIAKSWGFSMSI